MVADFAVTPPIARVAVAARAVAAVKPTSTCCKRSRPNQRLRFARVDRLRTFDPADLNEVGGTMRVHSAHKREGTDQ